jgi:hypothetical protein
MGCTIEAMLDGAEDSLGLGTEGGVDGGGVDAAEEVADGVPDLGGKAIVGR